MSPIKMSKWESGVRLVMRYCDAFNRHDIPAILALLADDCVLESFSPAPDGGVLTGKDSIQGFWVEYFRTNQKAHLDVEQVTGLGIHCILRSSIHWEDSDGTPRNVRNVDLFMFQQEKIIRQMSYRKTLS